MKISDSPLFIKNDPIFPTPPFLWENYEIRVNLTKQQRKHSCYEEKQANDRERKFVRKCGAYFCIWKNFFVNTVRIISKESKRCA